MRTLLIASTGVAMLVGGAADAQRMVEHGPGAGYPVPGASPMASARPMAAQGGYRTTTAQRGGRWGSKVGGHWWGGANAPGGWNAYRRPYRGWAVPAYWNSSQFYVDDWAGYGLGQPPQGYNWARYYDDAVLIDGRGSVYDTVGGVDWDRYDGQAADGYAGGDDVYAGPQDRDHADRGYDQPGYLPRQDGYDGRRSNGVGGAVAGAVVGGVAGNLIGGRGNRLGGTLIGAGVGAGVGYAIDRSSGRRAPRPPIAREGAGYPPPPGYAGDYRAPSYGAGYPAPVYTSGPRPGGWVSPDGATTVTTTTGGYYGGSSTTVVVQTAPVVTTTTTEIYEDAVTYSRPVHKVWRKRVWHPRPKPRCGCR